ncbi:MAG: DNA recombination protein RmuC [Candidatus Omnitrophica bacterium]|nr:DNA recombination protein RmuC [Candidatus Omnitrophota bacterium]
MEFYLFFLIALIITAAIIITFWWLSKRIPQAFDQEQIISRLKETLGALSFEALSKNTEQFLKLARQTLAKETEVHTEQLQGKKELIDQTLHEMREKLTEVESVVRNFENERKEQFGEVSTQLKSVVETTSRLQNALASSKARGQWGERMAEDVLRLAGFIEGVNYRKQKTLESGRPDFTFLLPQDLIVNMDVKFPFDNYLHYLEAKEDSEKQRYKEQFLRDVKARIKEVTSRDYINPAQNTIDYVILFIPNEQVYAFINEADSSMLDEALRNKVVFCSPLTLYAILAVIRQATDTFKLEHTTGQILGLLGTFNKQWAKFVESMAKMGKSLEDAQKEFDTLVSTRRRQLERSLEKIEELRTEKGINLITNGSTQTEE